MRDTSRRPADPGHRQGRTLKRRTLTRGAAWATPLIATSVAAPAYAVSGAPLQVTWADIIFLGDQAPGVWSFELHFTNTSALQTVTVTKFELITTYFPPAANTTPGQVVLTSTADLPTLTAGQSSTGFMLIVPSDYSIPPVDGGGTNIGEPYYCGNACGLLLDGATTLRFTFTAGADPAQTVDVPMTMATPCDEDECA